MALMTPELSMDYLKKLTSFPTRSYNNADASDKVEKFLKQEFEALGQSSGVTQHIGAPLSEPVIRCPMNTFVQHVLLFVIKLCRSQSFDVQ